MGKIAIDIIKIVEEQNIISFSSLVDYYVEKGNESYIEHIMNNSDFYNNYFDSMLKIFDRISETDLEEQ